MGTCKRRSIYRKIQIYVCVYGVFCLSLCTEARSVARGVPLLVITEAELIRRVFGKQPGRALGQLGHLVHGRIHILFVRQAHNIL
jgi:hypothetical protein